MNRDWRVERQDGVTGVWHFVHGAMGQRNYVLGYYHGLTSFLPRAAYRLIRPDGAVCEESPACRAPTGQRT